MNLQMLLVVIDPAHEAQPALERAAWLARQSGAALELLVCEHHAVFEAISLFDQDAREQALYHLLLQRRNWLETLAQPLRDQGLSVQTLVRWGKPLYQLVLVRVNELQPNILFKAASHHGVLSRLLLSNSCWQLIRHSPVPLWLVHHAAFTGYKRLCAAVDPLHSADKPATLDHRLLAAAIELASQLKMEAHCVHCYEPLPPSLVYDAELVANYPFYEQRCAQQHQQAFDQLLESYPQLRASNHLLKGFPEQVIPQFVRAQGIDLLLMGAVSRSHLDGALIGNTAERILEAVDCDLLVFRNGASG